MLCNQLISLTCHWSQTGYLFTPGEKNSGELTALSIKPICSDNWHNKRMWGCETPCQPVIYCCQLPDIRSNPKLVRDAAAELLPPIDCSFSEAHPMLYLCVYISPSALLTVDSPVAVDEASIDVVGALHPSDWLQADTSGLERHNVHQAVLEFVTRQVGTDKSWGMCFRVGQFLQREERHECQWGGHTVSAAG